MKIVIIGGTGLIGSKTVAKLQTLGHEAIAAAPSTGVDTYTGKGLDAALVGADVVIDLANSPSFEDAAAMDFFQTAGRNLLTAEKKAGVRHHVALSVVGTARLQGSSYFRAKQVQEDLITAGAVPYTVVHSTQFFEFLGAIARSGTVGNEVHVAPVAFQPILSDDVAEAVAAVAVAAPVNGLVQIAGPDRAPLNEMVAQFLNAAKDPRKVVADAAAPYFGVLLDNASLVPEGDVRLGQTSFANFLALGEFRT